MHRACVCFDVIGWVRMVPLAIVMIINTFRFSSVYITTISKLFLTKRAPGSAFSTILFFSSFSFNVKVTLLLGSNHVLVHHSLALNFNSELFFFRILFWVRFCCGPSPRMHCHRKNIMCFYFKGIVAINCVPKPNILIQVLSSATFTFQSDWYFPVEFSDQLCIVGSYLV